MEELSQYMLSFENGARLFINAKSIADATGKGLEDLIKCFPNDCSVETLRQPTVVRRIGNYCVMCGKPADRLSIEFSPGVDFLKVKMCVGCARTVADAYEEL